jgi:hypothetical protein
MAEAANANRDLPATTPQTCLSIWLMRPDSWRGRLVAPTKSLDAMPKVDKKTMLRIAVSSTVRNGCPKALGKSTSSPLDVALSEKGVSSIGLVTQAGSATVTC